MFCLGLAHKDRADWIGVWLSLNEGDVFDVGVHDLVGKVFDLSESGTRVDVREVIVKGRLVEVREGGALRADPAEESCSGQSCAALVCEDADRDVVAVVAVAPEQLRVDQESAEVSGPWSGRELVDCEVADGQVP